LALNTTHAENEGGVTKEKDFWDVCSIAM